MTSDVDEGAPGELGNLLEGEPLEEIKLNGFPLLRREPSIEFLHQRLSKNPFHRLLVERCLFPRIGQAHCGVFQFLARIKVARVEVAAPVEGAMVSHLKDPRTRCPVCAVKESCLAEEEEKDLLDEIIRLSFIPQNAVSDIPHWASVAAEEQAQRFPLSIANMF